MGSTDFPTDAMGSTDFPTDAMGSTDFPTDAMGSTDFPTDAMGSTVFPTDEELDELVLGPDSVAWRVASDMRLNVAMLYPLLLQVAHPTVDAGVREHSDFEHRPWDRLLRTIDYVSLLVYGGREAVAAGRRLREMHARFRGIRTDGTPYSALEPGAYAWVHATLLDTYVRVHARFGTPMSLAEIERFYAEYRGLGRLIGVRERDLPPTWTDFCAYFRHTARTSLTRTASVERVLKVVGHVAAPPLPFTPPIPTATAAALRGLLWPLARLPASQALRLGGIGLIEPAVRRRLKVRWTPVDEAQFRALGIALRGLTPVMPSSLRITGPAHLRWRTREIETGPLGRAALSPRARRRP